MITSQLSGAVGSVKMPNLRAIYMFSPFPLVVTSSTLASVTLRVTNHNTGRSHGETRYLYNGTAEFDAARIALLLSLDVDDVFSMNLGMEDEASPYTDLTVTLLNGTVTLWTGDLFGLYGTFDQLEARGLDERRRLWVNFPQTLQIWEDDEFWVETDADGAQSLALDALPGTPVVEMNIGLRFQAIPKTYAALMRGESQTVKVSTIFGGRDTLMNRSWRAVTLVPDLSPRDAGTFLRWLHRDGSFGYCLFKRGTFQTSAAQHDAFARHISGNPAEPVKGRYPNGAKADFSEARQMSLGTPCDDLAEYEYLCGLATSPVVERLVTVDGADRWQRVNIIAGSYSRDLKYNTPSRQTFEVTIELPARNTVTL